MGKKSTDRENKRKSREEQGWRQQDFDLDDFVNEAVQVGAGVGSTVLQSLSEALEQVRDSLAMDGDVKKPKKLSKWLRRLDRRLADSYGGWMALGVTGWTMLGCFAIATIVMTILTLVGAQALNVGAGEFVVFPILAATFAFVTVGFGWLGWFGCKKAGYFGRLRKYLRSCRGWTARVIDLARDTATNEETVRQELAKAVSEGRLPGVCLDTAHKTLYLDAELYEPEPAPQSGSAQGTAVQPTPMERFRTQGVEFLNYLKGCHGALGADTDAELTAMEKVCAAIVAFVGNHPEQLPKVRRFGEYYLPTTRKLLDTARGLGEMRTQGSEDIRRDITGILHTLNIAYAKLYDSLLQDISMDVSTEIGTLETMLNQDGLTHDFKSDFGVQGRS